MDAVAQAQQRMARQPDAAYADALDRANTERRRYIRNMKDAIFKKKLSRSAVKYIKANFRQPHAFPQKMDMALSNPLRASAYKRTIKPKNGSGSYSILYGN